jgi:hypothetical protein
MSITRRIVRLSVIPLLVGLLLIPDVASAAAPRNTTTVSIISGKAVVGGAKITIKYDCFPLGYSTYNSFGDVRVGQANGAFGDKFFHPNCNDRAHTQVVFVPNSSTRHFHRGDAAVGLFICGFDCNSASKEIYLH